jgi:UPF0271 protein
MNIDLNSDLGEGYGPWTMGDDEALLDIVSSANIACGFHAGDPSIMRRTVELAAERGVAIGAHVSYPDRRGFGRYDLNIPPDQVQDDVLYQIGALEAFARSAGTRVSYVKPHGALYNAIAVDRALARAVIAAVSAFDPSMPLLTQPGGAAAEVAAAADAPCRHEGFADRAYLPTGQLVPRSRQGAVLTEPDAVSQRVLDMVQTHEVTTIEGQTIPLHVDSICLHGDTPGAVTLARAVRDRLTNAGVHIEAFCPA